MLEKTDCKACYNNTGLVNIELSPEMVRAIREAEIANGESFSGSPGALELQFMVFDRLVVELGLPRVDEGCGRPDWDDPRVSDLWERYVEILVQLNGE